MCAPGAYSNDESCMRVGGAVQVLSVAQDQNGCRFLQRKFDEGGAGAVAVVLPEVCVCLHTNVLCVCECVCV